MLESWRWLHSLHSTVQSREVDWTQLDHVIDAVVEKLPQLAGIKMPHLKQASAFAARNWRVNRTVTAAVPRCAPISACTNRASRRIKTPCSPSLWKEQPAVCAAFANPIRMGAGLELPAGMEQVPG